MNLDFFPPADPWRFSKQVSKMHTWKFHFTEMGIVIPEPGLESEAPLLVF